MRSTVETPSEYLDSLSNQQWKTIARVRGVILEHLPPGFVEGMQYGMLAYCVPHSLYPKGYHVNPKLPLPYVSLAAQKNYYALYLMCLYPDSELCDWFTAAWHETGKKLDMGKSCVRFKRIEDLALDVLAQLLQRVTVDNYIASYEAALAAPRTRPNKAQSKSATAKHAKPKVAAPAKAPSTKAKSATAKAAATATGTKQNVAPTKGPSATVAAKAQGAKAKRVAANAATSTSRVKPAATKGTSATVAAKPKPVTSQSSSTKLGIKSKAATSKGTKVGARAKAATSQGAKVGSASKTVSANGAKVVTKPKAAASKATTSKRSTRRGT